MSVAFASMEVAARLTVGFKGHGPAAAATATASPTAGYVGAREFFGRVAAAAGGEGRGSAAMSATRRVEEEEEHQAESSESSSIGVAGESSLSLSSSSASDGEEEVQSKLKEGALGSLESLEECLPIKRGLSNCFAGKSKSFASLADAAALGSARELAKVDNPFNKRRRVLIACKASWQRRASYAALGTCGLRALDEEEEEDGEKGRGSEGCGAGNEPPASSPSPSIPLERNLGSTFRSPRSFSLSDLRHA